MAAPARPKIGSQQVQLIANGDLRLSANRVCWPAQKSLEDRFAEAVGSLGYEVVRAHQYDDEKQHGFIDSQKAGREVFQGIDPDAPLVVVEAVWQYSHHVLHGLTTHRGPILTAANWSGQWPGLVGMLNLNGSMTKAGVEYSTLWSDDFSDDYFLSRLGQWLKTGKCGHAIDHVVPLAPTMLSAEQKQLGADLANALKFDKAILGVFDEGCMGMFNAIIPDHLLNPCGVFKERLSQSALYYETTQVSDEEAAKVLRWYQDKGFTFHFGKNEAEDLTERQVLLQCKTYIAAMRIADDFGCDVIGIQYQQGLKDLLPASDLVEGTLNSTERPPVTSRDGKRELYPGGPLPHFNEVDECAGLDGLLINRVHAALGQPVENTLHDLRWGDWDASGTTKEYVWVFEISGSAPAEHHVDGWAGSEGFRQPPMYFPLGGSTLRGIAKPGEVVWSRIYMEGGTLRMDLGRGKAISLPAEETERRWQSTTPQWPIMHGVTYGVDREQMMARHKANHIQLAYAKDAASADGALLARAALADALGIDVYLCGTKKDGSGWG